MSYSTTLSVTVTRRVKMADGRRQGLNGHIVIEKAVYDGSAYWEVRFVKASGDPLEWRRFFKNMVQAIWLTILQLIFWLGEH
ncbi:hypothetical protein EON80_19975 [bacterium]|nr:MAG: hypothetical protein EON80_19975 [bacterium]